MRKLIFLFSVLIITGCVGQNAPPVITNNSATPVISIMPSATVSPVATTVNTTPTPANPVPTSTLNPVQTNPVPTAVPSPVSSPARDNKFIIGFADAFINVTDNKTDDAPRETNDTINNLDNLNASFVIVDFKQKIIDPDLDGEKLSWIVYDDILNGLREKDIHPILRVPHDRVLYGHDSPSSNSAVLTPVTNYIKFLQESEKHYKDYNISWMFGDKVNDQNSLPGTQKDYLDFLSVSSDAVKRITRDRTVYMGSFVQSEIFGQKLYFTAENLLSYLNLGAAKYTDGFIFEIYSLAFNDDKDFNSQSIFGGTDYKFEKKYYDSITEILKQKNVENKKIFLVTSTYTNTIINELNLTEEQQANDLARRLVYGISSGYDSVYLPELFDTKYAENSNFFQGRGLILGDNLNPYKKLSFWTFKFIMDKLKDTNYKGLMENLPGNMEGFIFEKDQKQYYVIWNNDKNFKGNISIPLKGNNVILNILPTDTSVFGIHVEIYPDPPGVYNISLNSYPQNLRILEVTQ